MGAFWAFMHCMLWHQTSELQAVVLKDAADGHFLSGLCALLQALQGSWAA